MASPSQLITANGTPTQFLPLSTPWPAATDCASKLYQHDDGRMLAWDPFYGRAFDAKVQSCHAPEVSAWWFQTAPPITTYTALGPSFACPQRYSTVQVALLADDTPYVYCCPSQYDLLVPQPLTKAFPSQCVSSIFPGQTFTYLGLTETTKRVLMTSVVRTGTVTVFGVPVNGFNIKAEATSSSGAPSRTDSSVPRITSDIPSSSSSSTTPEAGPSGSSSPWA
ncbi:hypothetical protein QBC47DRAFT_365904 [Echria macrotheca]|uniref:Uncharacterized protein n=1 Tax=Echria macrotheca TaxID=438768 RepID=A0AAJ0B1C5_9PEZI|nr:hypothetical protein QBC47DRAFT_365904 [Echria macrotheca]